MELVYEGRSPRRRCRRSPRRIDDAIETIRKRTDALGVSEPEIQRAGANQISIGLPDVENAERAIEQVGTTAQLQFYDWEPNVLGRPRPGRARTRARRPLYEAVRGAPRTSSRRPRPRTCRRTTRTTSRARRPTASNDTAGEKYYLFDPDES